MVERERWSTTFKGVAKKHHGGGGGLWEKKGRWGETGAQNKKKGGCPGGRGGGHPQKRGGTKGRKPGHGGREWGRITTRRRTKGGESE